MSTRHWLWLLALAGVVILGGFWWAFTPDSGEVEFQRTLEALKAVKSWKFSELPSEGASYSQEGTWEVDCAAGWHGIYRAGWLELDERNSTQDSTPRKVEVSHVGATTYMRSENGDWEPANSFYLPDSALTTTCSSLSRGAPGYPFPEIPGLLTSSFFVRGSTKKVSGVKCREWKVQVVKLGHREDFTVCLGTKDHLPYEISGEQKAHLVFSDYNQPVPIEGPK